MIIKILKSVVSILFISCVTVIYAQNTETILMEKVSDHLANGNCDKAQTAYDTWKAYSGKTNANLESLIRQCKQGGTNSNKGVLINGIRWATCNVGEKGAFVSSPEEYGNYYTFGEAQTVCPKGWRLPTWTEFNRFIGSEAEGYIYTGKWTTLNGTFGRTYGSGNNSIFLPAGGGYNSNGYFSVGKKGYYWSSSKYLTDKNEDIGCGRSLGFTDQSASNTLFSSNSNSYPCRCVKE
jgi:uncharacterized protein (TIGR02145 family)